MFCGKKEDIENVVEIIRKEICGYGTAHCDCKYGYEGNRELTPWSEQTGCPELYTVLELLKSMTREEYNELLSRHKNCLL